MRIHDRELGRAEILRRVGSLAQVGGVQLMAYEEGHARGTRALEFRTGSGLRFVVEPDRGFDVGFAEFAGTGLCWLPSKGLAGPWYYEGDLDGHAWLRVGLGGLFNTAGLVSMGTPQVVPTETFGFTQRMEARYGTHDRIAVTPASTFAHGQEWDGDRCRLWASGTVRQEIAYGEHLAIDRRYDTEIGARAFTITDRVTNEGWFDTPHQLLYHFNLGFPLLGDGAQVLAAAGDPDDLSFSTHGEGGSSNTSTRAIRLSAAGMARASWLTDRRATTFMGIGVPGGSVTGSQTFHNKELEYSADFAEGLKAWRE